MTELAKEWQFRSEIVRPDDVRIEVTITVPEGAARAWPGLLHGLPELTQIATSTARKIYENNEETARVRAEKDDK